MGGLLEVIQDWLRAFPDFAYRVEDQIAEGDKVMTRYTWWGTHRGVIADIAPTGRIVEVGGIDIFRIKDGKVAEVWRIEDHLSLMQQLGVLDD